MTTHVNESALRVPYMWPVFHYDHAKVCFEECSDWEAHAEARWTMKRAFQDRSYDEDTVRGSWYSYN